MKLTKRLLSILISCLMLLGMLSVGVCAAGTRDNPIDAATKWFGYGADTYLLNPTIAEGTTDGIWYTLTADIDGVLFLEHSYKNVDYTVTITLNGKSYVGGCVNGEPYNRPIVAGPIKVGDVATIQIVTKGAAAGTVYANMNVTTGDVDNAIKVKSNGLSIVVGAGETLYFQDDSLNAIYATKGLLVDGDVADTTFYTVAKNAESGAVVKKAITDSDKDGIIEATLGGNLGSAGAPPVKPGWAIENNSAKDQTYTLTIVNTAHECVYDDDLDTDCNSCGAIRETAQPCEHAYANSCDATCDLCGETRADIPHSPAGNYACNKVCSVCGVDLTTADHVYSFALDPNCDVCGNERDPDLPLTFGGASISADVNGLSCRYDVEVDGMAVNGTTAIYDNATFAGMKLLSMGAIVCNNFEKTQTLPTMEDVNGASVVAVPAKYLYTFDAATGTASFAIRVIRIPSMQKDASITFVPYVVVEDTQGNEHTFYITEWAYNGTYNEVLTAQ